MEVAANANVATSIPAVPANSYCHGNADMNAFNRQQSIFAWLPQDVFVYKLFPFLEDGDAMDCFETCKHLYYTITRHYRIKNIIDLKSLYIRPAYCSTSHKYPWLQRPKIIRGVIANYDLERFAKMLLRKGSFRSEEKGASEKIGNNNTEKQRFGRKLSKIQKRQLMNIISIYYLKQNLNH